jgi:hypothetical protein
MSASAAAVLSNLTSILPAYVDATFECVLYLIAGGIVGVSISDLFPFAEDEGESVLTTILFAVLQIMLFIMSLDAIKWLVTMVPSPLPGYAGLVSGAILASWSVMSGATTMKARITHISRFFPAL